MNVCLQDEVRNMVKDYNPVKVSLQVKEDRTYVSYPHVLIAKARQIINRFLLIWNDNSVSGYSA